MQDYTGGLIIMMKIFRERRFIGKVVLWVIVGMLAVGLLGSAIPSMGTKDIPKSVPDQTPVSPEIQTETGRLQALLQQYEKMAAERPQDPDVLTGYARVQSDLGRLYLEQGESAQGQRFLEQAAGRYQEALELRDEAGLRLELAGVYLLLNLFDQAELQVRTVLQKEPQNLQAKAQLGLVLEGRQDWKGAAAIWQELTKESDPEMQALAGVRLKMIREKMK